MAVLERTKSLKPVMDAGAIDVKKLVDDAFYQSIDPNNGKSWTPLQETTTSRRRQGPGPKKKKRVHKPLIDTGRLRGSITAVGQDKAIVYGTNVSYAGTHQYGSKHVPMRRFLPTDFSSGPAAKVIEKIAKKILKYLKSGAK